jgi:hypothetical protein
MMQLLLSPTAPYPVPIFRLEQVLEMEEQVLEMEELPRTAAGLPTVV